MKTLLHPVRSASTPEEGERGDVPGWVLVTLMSAGLVVLLWGVAGDALTNLFQQAMESVAGLG